jgi:hypothetical protein
MDLRKRLLMYKLLHHFDPIPDIHLTIKGREAQLFKPTLKIFQGTKTFEELSRVFSKYLNERREVKVDTFHFRVCDSIKELISKTQSLELEIKDVCDTIKENTPGEAVPNKPMTYSSEEFGEITDREIRNICIQVLGAKPSRHRRTSRKLIFNLDRLKQFENSFSLEEANIHVALSKVTDVTDETVFTSIPPHTDRDGNVNNTSDDKVTSNIYKNHDKDVSNNDVSTPVESDIDSIKASQPSQVSQSDS